MYSPLAGPKDIYTTSMADDVKEDLFKAIARASDIYAESLLQAHPELVNKYETKWEGTVTPLIQACHTGTLHLVKVLLKMGADVRASGYIKTEYGTNALTQPILFTVAKSNGGYGAEDDVFPLFVAARRAQIAMFKELLSAGASIHQTNAIGQTALHAASMRSARHNATAEESLFVIIKNGAEINLQDHNGKTALHYACFTPGMYRSYVVKALLENGADANIRDNKGLSCLDCASLYNFNYLEMMMKMCNFSTQQIIEAYETCALLSACRSPYKVLRKATMMRLEHGIPKTVLPPLECYVYTKEWETLEELERCENNQSMLQLHAMLARERIFKGRYVLFIGVEIWPDVTPLNALLRRHLEIFQMNNDYLYFADEFVAHDGLLDRLLYPPHMTMSNDTLLETARVALESCHRLQSALLTETKQGCTQELISQIERTLVTLGTFILELLNDNEVHLAQNLFKDLWKQFPLVVLPRSKHTVPLPHILLANNYAILGSWFTKPCILNRCQLLKMCLQAGFDLETTDSDGNTLLHVIVSSLPADQKYFDKEVLFKENIHYCRKETEIMVELLLENGTYIHAKNKSRKTVFDILTDPKYETCFTGTQFLELLQKYDQFPTLEHLAATKICDSGVPYKDQLPNAIVKFVDLH